MKERREIEVVPYDPDWPRQFEQIAGEIDEALGSNCVAVYHVGSTSVPGLCAKPKIDVIAMVNHPQNAIKPLEEIGMEYRGEYNIPLHYGFRRRAEVSLNLHVYPPGHPEIDLNLMFAHYLRQHPEERARYGALKQGLLSEPASFEKDNSMFTGYNLGKDDFIKMVLLKAGFNRVRVVKCVHHLEWAAAKSMRQRYFFDKVPISDPYTWTFNHPDHVHFLLYQGVEPAGYAHIQLWPNTRAAMRIIVLEEGWRGQGMGRQFHEWIERWLQTHSCSSIHVESTPAAAPFYEALGYSPMLFNDPDGYASDSRDIPLGKRLHV